MKKQKFNQNWIFTIGSGSSLDALAGGNNTAKQVTLPHDASIGRERNPEEPNGSGNGFFREESYVYTKTFSMNADDKDKTVYLEFEGVYRGRNLQRCKSDDCWSSSSCSGQCTACSN